MGETALGGGERALERGCWARMLEPFRGRRRMLLSFTSSRRLLKMGEVGGEEVE